MRPLKTAGCLHCTLMDDELRTVAFRPSGPPGAGKKQKKIGDIRVLFTSVLKSFADSLVLHYQA